MDKTLIVTNDFPPRPGGIQAFLHNMALRVDPAQLVVYASTWKRGAEGAAATAAFDAEQPFTVVRDRTTMLLPTPGSPGGRPGCCGSTAARPSGSAPRPRSV
ncbi:hypothetical protein Sfulv_14260 [Streptomyces fulvorobeus]|uniref:Uncharacterized protein n=1 Tax=Streptomyces fulvorobeus TaxID=284028 RepID=A0A7J0C273_9ACTN|nr:hypothetical protein Sfulv_14260 [Streptomyces fulvorobeus]